jgi:hypothetical protein
MKLHAILNYYDESPTWLAATVASLSRIGVDHVLAIDGRYPHFKTWAPSCSPVEQAVAIMETGAAIGAAVTVHRPDERSPIMEAAKRERAFQTLHTLATPMQDWVLVIDADELVEAGTHEAKRELAGMDASIHVASCRISSQVDPHAQPGPDNDVRANTEEMHQKLLIDPKFTAKQSRFWRVMHDMRVGPSHYDYTGVDDDGERWYLRSDIGSMKDTRMGLRCAPIGRVDACDLLHRKNLRTHVRRTEKAAYYTLRDQLGLEKAETGVAT